MALAPGLDPVVEANARMNARLVMSLRDGHVEDKFMSSWKDDIDDVKSLYVGDWDVEFPDKTVTRSKPKVMNLVQIGLDDLSALASETIPQVRCPAPDDEEEKEAALLREAILKSIWVYNEGEEIIVPMLAFDLAGAGFGSVAVGYSPACAYPEMVRLDPAGSYPTIANGKLIDLIQLSHYSLAQAEAVVGYELSGLEGWGDVNSKAIREVEIIDYYGPNENIRVVAKVQADSISRRKISDGVVVDRWQHGFGKPTVAAAWRHTLDGRFRGIFDQVSEMQNAENRIITYELDYAHQQVYAPWEAHEVENWDEDPGPATVYRVRDPSGFMRRVAPASNSPQLINLLAYMKENARGAIGRPESREGNISQSIASAAFVSSTLGQLTTLVKTIQRHIARIRRNANEIALRVDEMYLDDKKPLLVPSHAGTNYTPSSAIKGSYQNMVIYGAGAGLDALNKKVAVLQDIGAGLASRETGMEQTDYIQDPKLEQNKIERERLRDVFFEKVATSMGLHQLAQLDNLMEQGYNLSDSFGILAPVWEQEAAAQQPVPQGGPGAPAQPVGPMQAAQQLQAGGIPAGPGSGTAPERGIPLPPQEIVTVRPFGG